MIKNSSFYRLVASYKGADRIEIRDKELEKLVGSKTEGSGFALLTGDRELFFSFDKSDLGKLKNIIQKLKKKKYKVQTYLTIKLTNKNKTLVEQGFLYDIAKDKVLFNQSLAKYEFTACEDFIKTIAKI